MHRRALLGSIIGVLLAGCSGGGRGPQTEPLPKKSFGKPQPAGHFKHLFQRLTTKYDIHPDQYRLIIKSKTAAVVEYEAIDGDKDDYEHGFTEAYTELVKEHHVSRSLKAFVSRNNGTNRNRWYTWEIDVKWVRAYVSDEITEDEFDEKIQETIVPWYEPLDPKAFKRKFDKYTQKYGLDPKQYILTIESPNTATIEYTTPADYRFIFQSKFQDAYVEFVKNEEVIRDLEGHVRKETSDTRWFVWEIENDWATKYANDEITRRDYVLKISRTIKPWISPLSEEQFKQKFDDVAKTVGIQPSEYLLDAGNDETATIQYHVSGTDREKRRHAFQAIYTAVIDRDRGGRNLEGRELVGNTENSYKWVIEISSAEKYLSGKISKEWYTKLITETIAPIADPLPSQTFEKRFMYEINNVDVPPTDYTLTTESTLLASIEYDVETDQRGTRRGKFADAYTTLVSKANATRILIGHETVPETKKTYKWEIEPQWAKACENGIISEDQYRKTIADTLTVEARSLPSTEFEKEFQTEMEVVGIPPSEYHLDATSDEQATLVYSVASDEREAKRAKFAEAYATVVEKKDALRDLTGHERISGTRNVYQWEIHSEWASEYRAHEFSKRRYLQLIAKTLQSER